MMNFTGLCIGIGTFLIIGVMHPVVIKTEYYLGAHVWPVYLILGLGFAGLSLWIPWTAASALSAVLGFSFLWGIHELIEQEERVRKGWFPKNPDKKDKTY